MVRPQTGSFFFGHIHTHTHIHTQTDMTKHITLLCITAQGNYWFDSCMATITQVQQQLHQTRVRVSEMERVMREKEQIQQRLETRIKELQHLRTKNEQLQTANAKADEQICQLQLLVSDIIIVQVLFDSCLPSHRSNNSSSR